jgi:hypothetical protein
MKNYWLNRRQNKNEEFLFELFDQVWRELSELLWRRLPESMTECTTLTRDQFKMLIAAAKTCKQEVNEPCQ